MDKAIQKFIKKIPLAILSANQSKTLLKILQNKLDTLSQNEIWELEPPGFILQYAVNKLSPNLLRYCAQKAPKAALLHTINKLPSELLEYCVHKKPEVALQYVLDKLSPELIKDCAMQLPGLALQYASHKLSNELLEYCVEKSPEVALQYTLNKLSPELIEYCSRIAPEAALRYALGDLSFELKEYCIRTILEKAFKDAFGKELTIEMLGQYSKSNIEKALKYAFGKIGYYPRTEIFILVIYCLFDELSMELINYCVKKAPNLAICYLFDKLPTELQNYCAHKIWGYLVYSCSESYLKGCEQKYIVPQEIISYCAKQMPEVALKSSSHLSPLLSSDLLNELAQEYPETALQYASQYLSTETLIYCIKQYPEIALTSYVFEKYNKLPKKILKIAKDYQKIQNTKEETLIKKELWQIHGTLKLQIELVPSSCFWSNIRSYLKQSQWDKIRKQVYEKANYCCEICGEQGIYYPVACHEVWKYDDIEGIQTLSHFQALCMSCHDVKHIGYAKNQGRGEQAFNHFKKINQLEHNLAKNIIKGTIAYHKSTRDKKEWKLDIEHLKEYGISPEEVVKYQKNRVQKEMNDLDIERSIKYGIPIDTIAKQQKKVRVISTKKRTKE